MIRFTEYWLLLSLGMTMLLWHDDVAVEAPTMQVNSEGQHQDLKLTFDPDKPKAKVELVKDLVAMANGGGGRIIFGCNETTQPGMMKR